MPMIDRDTEHLRLLSISQYVMAGVYAFYSLLPIFHLIFGIGIIVAAKHSPKPLNDGNGPPELVGWIFLGAALLFILIGMSFAVGMFLTGRFMGRRKHWVVCLVLAGIECLLMPFGTVLGIFTILVLTRSNVKRMFGVKLSQSEAALLELTEPSAIQQEPSSNPILPDAPSE